MEVIEGHVRVHGKIDNLLLTAHGSSSSKQSFYFADKMFPLDVLVDAIGDLNTSMRPNHLILGACSNFYDLSEEWQSYFFEISNRTSMKISGSASISGTFLGDEAGMFYTISRWADRGNAPRYGSRGFSHHISVARLSSKGLGMDRKTRSIQQIRIRNRRFATRRPVWLQRVSCTRDCRRVPHVFRPSPQGLEHIRPNCRSFYSFGDPCGPSCARAL